MLKIIVPPFEIFDEATNTFISESKPTVLKMENSLYAISQWEMFYKKPYFPKKNKNPYKKKEEEPQRTPEEMIYYMRCMVLDKTADEIDEKIFLGLSQKNFEEITKYLQDSQSATKIPEDKNSKGNSIQLTSEVIYAWMSELQIPWEAQYWNINRLFNVIQIINEDNTPPDKKKKKKAYEQMKEWSQINDKRLKEMGTKG